MQRTDESDDMPTKAAIMMPLLRLIDAKGGKVRPAEAVDALADEFKLTEEQRKRLNPSGTNNLFYNRVNWVRLKLVKDGYLSDEYYGVWVITDEGRKVLRSRGHVK